MQLSTFLHSSWLAAHLYCFRIRPLNVRDRRPADAVQPRCTGEGAPWQRRHRRRPRGHGVTALRGAAGGQVAEEACVKRAHDLGSVVLHRAMMALLSPVMKLDMRYVIGNVIGNVT